ncbi:MAG: serine protease [Myxococcota bacterium]
MQRILKALALLVGGPLALLATMALTSTFTSSLWVQFGLGVTALLVVPLLVSDRLLPDDVEKGKGLPSTVLAFTWVLVAVLVFGIGLPWSSPLLAREAGALDENGLSTAAVVLRTVSLETPEANTDVSSDHARARTKPRKARRPIAPRIVGVLPHPVLSGTEISDDETESVEELTPRVLFERWAPSVLGVRLGSRNAPISSGTAFMVSEDLAVTNHHVVAFALDHSSVRVRVNTKGGEWASRVQIVDFDVERDLALLRVRFDSPPPPVTLATDDAIEVGTVAISIGNPLGLEHTLTDGIVSSRRIYHGKRFVQVSTPVSPGNSGGPIFDAHGEVIGVATEQVGAYSRGQNLNLAVPSSDVQTFLDRTPEVETRTVGGGAPNVEAGSW